MKLYKIKKSNIDKRGLYASRNIKEGTKIIEYIGKIISKKESEKNIKFDNEKDIYLFNLNNKYDHSCDPNCEVTGKGLKLWILAIKNIKKGEELSYDYGFSYDKDYKQFPCKCGENNCVGYIVRAGSRWRMNKKFNKQIALVSNFFQK